MSDSTAQAVLFDDCFDKPVAVKFDAESQSSDGGVLLVGAIDRAMGLTARLAACLVDRRDLGRSLHAVEDLVRQRVYSIALGYADGNDAGRVAADPALKTACGRGPVHGRDLASQPTISRFENAATARDLVFTGRAFERHTVAYLSRTHRRARVVTLDFDSSEDPTHGQQQFTFFNAYYGAWCYVPAFAFLSFDNDPEQYLVHARLRPGNSVALRGALPVLRRLVALVREHFPRARVRVRLDAGYASGHLFDVLEALGVEYLVAMPSNAVLERLGATLMDDARRLFPGGGGRLFGDFYYKARDWSRQRRVVVKAEVVAHPGRAPRDNPRYVVTNVRQLPERAYAMYCGRGDAENRLKELHHDLEVGRTSSPSFRANQLRVLLTATAFALLQEMRRRLHATELRRAQVGTLRTRLLKIAARVVESVRRVVLHVPRDFPWASAWRRVARGLGAVPG